MSNEVRKGKNQYLNILLHKTGLRPHKDDLLSGYNVSSTSELTDIQIDELTQRLQSIADEKKSDAPKRIRSLRSACLTAAENYLGFRIVGQEAWLVFNKFMLEPRVCGKMLWELNETELKTLNNKLQSMGKKRLIK